MRNRFVALVAILSVGWTLGCDSKKAVQKDHEAHEDHDKGHDDHEGHDADHEGHDDHDEDEGHAAKPQHGGVVIEVGDEVAHLEFVHEPKARKVASSPRRSRTLRTMITPRPTVPRSRPRPPRVTKVEM